jgi:hypothetical protein
MLFILALACQPEPSPIPEASACTELRLELGAGILADRGCGRLDLQARILGEGTLGLRFDLLDQTEAGAVIQPVIEGQGTWTGLALEGGWALDGEEEPAWWRQGYQSWSWSGVSALSAPELDAEGLPVPGGDGDGLSVAWETEGTSWWGGLLGRPEGASWLMGVSRAWESRFYLGADDRTAWAVWGHRGERVAVDGELRLDPLFLSIGEDPAALHQAWAEAVAGQVPPRALGPAPPTGWATWYQFYSEVTEAQVRENLEIASAINRDPTLAPLEVFQLDDGWQEAWGIWTAGEDFPSGMAALAAEIQAAGMVPGLWMAPFYVHRDSDTFRENPDWWVRDEQGEVIAFTNLGTGDYAIIDASHPQAGPWMAGQVAERVAEGWTYLKLDFLYAGAQEGQRYQELTGTQAYRLGMELLREAAGESWVLACGAPLLPSVGWVEQYRTGADIAFEISPDPDPAYLRWQVHNTLARGFSNGLWWWIDPDQLILREPFSLVQARGAVVAQAVSGGAWLLGDDLASLPEERLALALAPEAVALRGQAASPEDPLRFLSGLDPSPTAERANPDDAVPTRWLFPDGTVALLNLGEGAVEVQGPGGRELLSGEEAAAGSRRLEPGAGELWRP